MAQEMFCKLVSVGSDIGNFLNEDLPQITASLELLRIFLVRLNSRNRLLNPANQILLLNSLNPTNSADCLNYQPAKEELPNFHDRYYRIDNKGRKFQYVKKINILPNEEKYTIIPCKKRTHRGKRKRKIQHLTHILKKSITTFSQIIPNAQVLPKSLTKLYYILDKSLKCLHNEIVTPLYHHLLSNPWDVHLHQVYNNISPIS